MLLAEIPLITDYGNFIINGNKRIIILILYFQKNILKNKLIFIKLD